VTRRFSKISSSECAAGLAGETVVEARPTICTTRLQTAFSSGIARQLLLSDGGEFRLPEASSVREDRIALGHLRRTTPT